MYCAIFLYTKSTVITIFSLSQGRGFPLLMLQAVRRHSREKSSEVLGVSAQIMIQWLYKLRTSLSIGSILSTERGNGREVKEAKS